MSTASKAQSAVGDEYLGRVLDERYRLDELIGAGATGRVYAARQLAVDRVVAIKLLHPSIRDRDLGTERFLREAKAVARLSHASCLTLFDFGMDEALDCFYMVTEFVQGETLADFMARERPERALAYSLLFQITTALEHAHACGILHRDLKPENIMLVDAPQSAPQAFAGIKVLDFGLARLREEAGGAPGMLEGDSGEISDEDLTESGTPLAARLTHFGELNGTPAYMSPEQCRGELNLTLACDYYALGVLAYEILEGKLPFVASSIPRLLLAHLNDPIPMITAPDVPGDVVDMVHRLLRKDAATRLQSSGEVLEILRRYMAPGHAFGSGPAVERPAQDSPVGARQAVHPVAESGAQTLINYTLSDTPIPQTNAARASVPIEFKTTVAAEDVAAPTSAVGDEESVASLYKSTAKRGRYALALVLILGLGAGAWWLGGRAVGDSQDVVQSIPLQDLRGSGRSATDARRQVVGAPTPGNGSFDSNAQPAREAAAALGSRDDGPFLDAQAVPTDAPPRKSMAESEAESPEQPGPNNTRIQKSRAPGGEAKAPRPRKLELTY